MAATGRPVNTHANGAGLVSENGDVTVEVPWQIDRPYAFHHAHTVCTPAKNKIEIFDPVLRQLRLARHAMR